MQKEFTFTVTLTFDKDLAGKEKALADALAYHLGDSNADEAYGFNFASGVSPRYPVVQTAKVSIEAPTIKVETYTAERS